MRHEILMVEQWPVDLFQYIFDLAVDKAIEQIVGYPQATINTIPDRILEVMLAHSMPTGHA